MRNLLVLKIILLIDYFILVRCTLMTNGYYLIPPHTKLSLITWFYKLPNTCSNLFLFAYVATFVIIQFDLKRQKTKKIHKQNTITGKYLGTIHRKNFEALSKLYKRRIEKFCQTLTFVDSLKGQEEKIVSIAFERNEISLSII